MASSAVAMLRQSLLVQSTNRGKESIETRKKHVYNPAMAHSGRRVITISPENSETPAHAFRNWITPNAQFYVRNHFDDPEIDRSGWSLAVTGCVKRDLRLTWEALSDMPQASLVATLECAGNGRAFLEGENPGVQWEAGAVGNAEWSGVAVSKLLESAGIAEGALEAVFEGSDSGVDSEPAGKVRFARSLPLAMALHPDTLIALRMNGEVLEKAHGYPARLVVPGWYGVASVKWLRAIRVVSEPFQGYFQSARYTVKRRTARGLRDDVVAMMLPKSEITRPRPGEPVAMGSVLIEGVAWAGPESVAAVEVSCDGGQSWRKAELVGPKRRYAWTHWRLVWSPSRPGPRQLLARAVSESGEIQPTRHNPLHGGYHINFSRPLEVSVRERQGSRPLTFEI